MFRTTLPQTYRAAPRLHAIVAGFGLGLAVLNALGAQRSGQWLPLQCVLAGWIGLHGLLRVPRLRIDRHGLRYRDLSGQRTIAYAQVRAARLQVRRSSAMPQGAAQLVLALDGGGTQPLNLRVFPIAASAMLLRQLDRHGIGLDVPDAWAARRMAEQMAAARRRLPGGP